MAKKLLCQCIVRQIGIGHSLTLPFRPLLTPTQALDRAPRRQEQGEDEPQAPERKAGDQQRKLPLTPHQSEDGDDCADQDGDAAPQES